MFLDRRIVLTMGCLLVSMLDLVQGEESRKSRSIKNHVDRPLQVRRPNSIQIEDRVYNRQISPLDYSIERNYLERSNSPNSNVIVISMNDDDSRELHEEEEKLFRVITSKDYRVSSPADLENFDRIGERMIARANITEEARRVVRQVKRQRPGLFWTLARVAFETVNETRSAVQQISTLVEDFFAPETTTVRGGISTTVMSSTTQQVTTTSGDNSTGSTITTTEKPFELTVSDLQRIIRRNIRGLVRLFNIEWRDAVNQSQTNVREFQRDLGNRIGPFLKDNPDVV